MEKKCSGISLVQKILSRFQTARKYKAINILNKPENPFQNYDLAKNYLEVQNKFFCIKNILIQPLEVQKPETGHKTGLGPTGNLYG